MSLTDDVAAREPFAQHGQSHTSRAQPHSRKPRMIRRLLALLWPHALPLLGVIGCICLTTALGLAPPLLIAVIIDHAIAERNVALLIIFISLMIAAAVVTGLITILQTYLTSVVSQRIVASLRERVYARLLDLPIGYFHTVKLGDLLARFNSDIVGIQGFLAMTGVGVIANILVLLGSLFLIAVFDWRLALLAAIVALVFTLPTRQVGRKGRAISQLTQEKIAGLGALLAERLGISGVVLVKIFGQRKREAERFRRDSQELMRLQIHQSMVGRWLFMFTNLFSAAAPAVAYLIGGLEVMRVIQGHLTLGETVASATVFIRLYLPAIQLLNTWVDVQRVSALLKRVFDLLDEPAEVEPAPQGRQDVPQVSSSPSLSVEHLRFSYVDARPVLNDVTFRVAPGATVALVGPSGVGKSTLLNLIPRLYTPDAGRILLGAQDIQEIPLDRLRQRIGMVTQETYLLHASVLENIIYGRPDASMEEVISAARAAYIHDVVMSLPAGYQTLVGERGYRLSGGEKQRIAIARVILKDPDILLLDEATSALDAHSEALVQAAIKTLMRGRTTLVVAHRLSTVREADMIIVLDGARIVEQGSHDELMAANGLYSHLYHAQAERTSAPVAGG